MDKYRILCVEDELDTSEIIQAFLSPEFEVCMAYNGVDGLTKLPYVEPDLIMADVMMPIMDGRSFVKELRRKPGYEKTPVIFLSGLSSKSDIKEGYEAGANLYLTKPIEPERLLKNIEQVLKDQAVRIRPKRFTFPQYEEWILKREKAKPPQSSSIPTGTPASSVVSAESPAKPEHLIFKPRVLVVDDDPDVLKILMLPIGDIAELITAQDGIVALEKTVRYKPDIFIIDWMMPRMTGYQLCQMIKRSVEFRDAPIIFISAKSTHKDQEFIKRLGVYKFLAKPFNVSDLHKIVEEIAHHPDFKVKTDRPSFDEVMKEEQIHHDVRWTG